MKVSKEKEGMLCKVVYFDEDSVTDFIQIVIGGKLEKTTELLNQSQQTAEAGASAGASVGFGGVLKALIGFRLEASAEANLDTSFSRDRMVKNIVKNTILTDFIALVNKNSAVNNGHLKTIRRFDGFSISAPKESLSYVALISPYLSMLKGGTSIPAGEYNIAIDKLDNTIKSAKGYYEFIGKNSKETVILRFNIKSFKNNYKVTDLLKMDVSIYAIKVGTSSIDKLNFNNEFDIQGITKDNPSYEKNNQDPSIEDKKQILEVYDVLLAGVEIYG